MKKLLIIVCIIALFTNCNNTAGSGGWSSQERQKGLKLCMDEVEGKIDNATGKKYCNCVLEKAMRKYKTYDEAQAAPDEEGVELAQACANVLQGGGGDDPGDEPKKGKGGGLFGGGGWSKSDKNNFLTPCTNSMVNQGYSAPQAKQLCDCALGKLEKKYTSLAEADKKGGEQAGAATMQECMTGNMNDEYDNENNDNNDDNEDNDDN